VYALLVSLLVLGDVLCVAPCWLRRLCLVSDWCAQGIPFALTCSLSNLSCPPGGPCGGRRLQRCPRARGGQLPQPGGGAGRPGRHVCTAHSR
jgi:hypothetical protein